MITRNVRFTAEGGTWILKVYAYTIQSAIYTWWKYKHEIEFDQDKQLTFVGLEKA
jgi:hypothetical protein